MESTPKYAAALALIAQIANAHKVDLSRVEFSNNTRGGYFAANDGSYSLEWRTIELIGAKLPNGQWCEFDMNGNQTVTAMNIAAWTGQEWYIAPVPPVPAPTEADNSPLVNRTGEFIGAAIPGKPGEFALKFPLPEGKLHSEGGKLYRIRAEKTPFGLSYVAVLQ